MSLLDTSNVNHGHIYRYALSYLCAFGNRHVFHYKPGFFVATGTHGKAKVNGHAHQADDNGRYESKVLLTRQDFSNIHLFSPYFNREERKLKKKTETANSDRKREKRRCGFFGENEAMG
ncbi:hypothetical protein AKJ41_00735 [candidate division MSBL1 archaeon SCGC-AAA259O05]|uniref:Uncharacterized protein n=1 Tax=candidate division MSBL1 archaeon SCGC-AAA259O05 TaxID=1698271 RepID=A0A133V5D8_9EURY|nr:hypothetical protein AKJ41_00735 [candidate division MSBL1 archaeon SCGC-AAA259O05]